MAEETLGRLVRNLDAGILVEDGQRRVRFTNRAFCSMFGIRSPPEALVGGDCAAAAAASAAMFVDPAGFLARIVENLRAAEIRSDVLELRDGRTWERFYLPLSGPDGGHVWVYRDVSSELRTLVAAVERADSAAELLQQVSFGLRAQLHTVLGFAELCAGARTVEEVRSAAAALRRGAHALQWTLGAMVEASRADDAVDTVEFDPVGLVEDVVVGLAYTARDRGQPLILEVGDDVPARVSGHAQRLHHVLVSAIAGVLEGRGPDEGYTSVRLDAAPGALVVEVARSGGRRTAEPASPEAVGLGLVLALGLARRAGARLELGVTGEGSFRLGFPVSAAEGAPAGSDAADGLAGLRVGLAGEAGPVTSAVGSLLRRLNLGPLGPVGIDEVGALGEADVVVMATSPERVNRLTLPVRGRDGRHLPVLWIGRGALEHPITRAGLGDALAGLLGREREADLPSETPTRARLLVVEDSPANAAVLGAMLSRAGYEVHVVEEAGAALALFEAHVWSLVLMDLDLPDMQGDELARRMRESEARSGRARTPVVACTAQVTADARQRCEAAGMDGFLGKPLHRDLLLSEVRRLLRPKPGVLVVDDAIETHVLYDRWLAELDVPILHARDGLSALELLARREAAAVLLDVEMPGIDGVETARRIRALPHGPALTILVVTGHTDPEVRRRAIAAGADRVLVKPVVRAALLAAVRPSIGRVPTDATPPPAVAEGPEPSITIDPDLAELLPEYVQESRAAVGRLAADIEAGAFERVERVAHRLKGSGASYGFPGLTALATRLEAEAAARRAEPCRRTVAEVEALLSAVDAALRGREANPMPVSPGG